MYDAPKIFKYAIRVERSRMRHMSKCLEDHKYVFKFRTVCKSTSTVQDIFWAHHEFVKLLNTFPAVLLMYSTYKINLYKMSLFQIVGKTSTTWHIVLVLIFWMSGRKKKKGQLHVGSTDVSWSYEICRKYVKGGCDWYGYCTIECCHQCFS